MSWYSMASQLIHDYKKRGIYRRFLKIDYFKNPYCFANNQRYINWTNNDYNDIVNHTSHIKDVITKSLAYGTGSGGTRNIP